MAESQLKNHPAVKAAIRVARVARDGWLVIGVTLLFAVMLEVAYRTQASVRRALRGDDTQAQASIPHPNAGQEWWDDGYDPGRIVQQYDPYRAFWPLPSSGAHVNVDTLGRRFSYNPSPAPDGPQVFFFGGSTMWGWEVRDRYTIPSQVSDPLAAHGVQGARMVNLAQSRFNVTQGVASLMLELRAGRIPDAVVFLDGNNDIAPLYQGEAPGNVLNQRLIEIALRGKTPWEIFKEQSKLMTRLTRVRPVQVAPAADGEVIASGSGCSQVADQVANLTTLVTSLGNEYGFAALFYWQPMLAVSDKPLTPWEASVPADEGWPELVRECTAATEARMAANEGVAFSSLRTLFDDETESVFTDHYGHLTEAANGVVAQRMADDLAAALGARQP